LFLRRFLKALPVNTSSPSRSISFLVTAMNEEALIATVVDQIEAVAAAHCSEHELILINDGSVDATGRIMDESAKQHAHMRVLHNESNLGLGASYRRGVQEARCEYVMLLCGDGGLPADSLPAILERVGDADIVIPFMTNLKEIKTRSRFYLSRAYTGLLNLFAGLKLRYYNGLAVHRVDAVRELDIKTDRFGFQGEILIKLIRQGHSYVEVGVKGAEKANRSSALQLRNLLNMVNTLRVLLGEIARCRP
jgi:glycosyltransferase involved in cell wall biosynthesis